MMLNELTVTVINELCNKIRSYDYDVVNDLIVAEVNYYITDFEFTALTKVLSKTKLGYLEYNVHTKCIFKLYVAQTRKYTNYELANIIQYSEDFEKLVNVLGQHIVYDYMRLQKYRNVELGVPTHSDVIGLRFVDDYSGKPIKLIGLTDNKLVHFFNKYSNDKKYFIKYELNKDKLHLFLNPKITYEFIDIGKCLSLFLQEKYYELLGEVSRTMYSVMYGRYDEKETKSSYLLSQS